MSLLNHIISDLKCFIRGLMIDTVKLLVKFNCIDFKWNWQTMKTSFKTGNTHCRTDITFYYI